MKHVFEIESIADDDIDKSVACSYDSIEDMRKKLLGKSQE